MNNLSKWTICITLLLFFGCNNESAIPESDKVTNDSVTKPIPPANSDKQNNDSLFQNKSSLVNNESPVNILGNWALAETDATTFIIYKKKIFYPESFISYPYKIAKDTLKIRYADYEGVFLIKKPHTDTLILASDDDVQVYYRFHNNKE